MTKSQILELLVESNRPYSTSISSIIRESNPKNLERALQSAKSYFVGDNLLTALRSVLLDDLFICDSFNGDVFNFAVSVDCRYAKVVIKQGVNTVAYFINKEEAFRLKNLCSIMTGFEIQDFLVINAQSYCRMN